MSHRFLISAVLVLAACGGGGSGTAPSSPPGKAIDTPAFQTYRTDHNGYNRIRTDKTTPADAEVIAGFEDARPDSPAGYRNLVDLAGSSYADTMTVEVIGQMEGDKAKRILRLTVDEAPFLEARAGRPVSADGKYYFRGANFVWASIDGAPIVTGANSDGLVNMELDFGKQTASLRLETGVNSGSDLRSEMTANDLPFNIRTGAYGGDVTLSVWDPGSADILRAAGSLRGSVGGRPEFADNKHDMTTSGLYRISGRDPVTGRQVDADGIFLGADPNAAK